MRFIVPLLVLVASMWYVYQGYSFVFPSPIFIPAFGSVSAFVLAFTLFKWHKDSDGQLRKIWVTLRAIAFILALAIFLLALVLFVHDVLLGASNLFAGSDVSQWPVFLMAGGGFIVLLACLLIYGLFRNPHRYQVHHVRPTIKDLPLQLKGLRIVQLSDIHAGTFLHKDPIQAGVDMINDLRPDLILFTGDLVNRKSDEIEPYLEIFAKLSARLGIYSVLGNHDYGDYYFWSDESAKHDNFQNLELAHQRLGWNLLRNEHRIIQDQGASLAIVGVENYSASPRFHRYGDLSRAIQGLPEDMPTILLSHDPSHWRQEVVGKYPQVDLTLSGHTHGFQFGFEWKEVFKWSPVQYIYKEWAGLYQEGKQLLYVNRGFGMLGYPGRVGILPEITLLELF